MRWWYLGAPQKSWAVCGKEWQGMLRGYEVFLSSPASVVVIALEAGWRKV